MENQQQHSVDCQRHRYPGPRGDGYIEMGQSPGRQGTRADLGTDHESLAATACRAEIRSARYRSASVSVANDRESRATIDCGDTCPSPIAT